MGRPRIIIRPTSILRKQMGQMQKLLGAYSKKKVQYLEQEQFKEPEDVQTEGLPTFLSQTRGVRSKHITRRQFVLNRHFTEIISDVLATEFKDEIDKMGINITSIETKAWNKGVRIFYTSRSELDQETRKKLRSLVVHLRTAITQGQLIGRTPLVNFVEDRSLMIDKILEDALSKIRISEPEETRLSKTSPNQLHISSNIGSSEQKLISKRFVAPSDMDNTMLGLDYPSLYDEVAVKLSKGRGETSRIVSNSNVLATAKPLFRAPIENYDEIDPVTRLKRMQKFIISQKQKNLNMSRVKRMKEIIDREQIKVTVDDRTDDRPYDDTFPPDERN